VLAVAASSGERAAVRGVWRALQLRTGCDVTGCVLSLCPALCAASGVPPCNSQLVTALLRSYRVVFFCGPQSLRRMRVSFSQLRIVSYLASGSLRFRLRLSLRGGCGGGSEAHRSPTPWLDGGRPHLRLLSPFKGRAWRGVGAASAVGVAIGYEVEKIRFES